MKLARCEAVSVMGFLYAKNLPTTLAVLLMSTSVIPALFAQRDVHASLIATADRKPAPQPELTSETGKATRLSDYRGKVVLLNFWATDCGGCVLEIPSIMDVQAEYKNKAFTVVGISMDIPYEDLKNEDEAWGKVKPFIAKKKINYPILMGRESLFKDFGLTQLPDTLLIDKAGKIAAVYVGIIDKGNVEANITKLLSE
jgi:peroxiredoxin